MKAQYRQRYERYLNEGGNRFADVNEVREQAESINISDLKKGKKTSGGFPLMVDNDHIWIDPADHHACATRPFRSFLSIFLQFFHIPA